MLGGLVGLDRVGSTFGLIGPEVTRSFTLFRGWLAGWRDCLTRRRDSNAPIW